MFIIVFWIFEMGYCSPTMIMEVWKKNCVYVSDGTVITVRDELLSRFMSFPTDAGNLVADWPFPVFINNSATLKVSPANKQEGKKSTSAGCMQPTHTLRIQLECVNLNPLAACNAASGIIYIYCCCMFYLNIWHWCCRLQWGGNCQVFAWVCPKRGKVANLKKKGRKSDLLQKKRKMSKRLPEVQLVSSDILYGNIFWPCVGVSSWCMNDTADHHNHLWLQEMPQ